ncbi:acetyltransferase [Paenibacillus sp. 1001270B_150601_E10]|uniref:acetyltransferase n=1 Tax=Paenibacillus sp. 1001270B_150601_E10 TaxID=2787079 RepID=UPI00189F2AAF|nr:acetyltransferase [Paenibacillus sp. 1001270B_150601_E10]
MSKPVIILGSGGHAKVLYDILMQQNIYLLGYTDPFHHESKLKDLNYLGDDTIIYSYLPEDIDLVLGVGKISNESIRDRIYKEFSDKGYTFRSVVHKSATISPSASYGKGVQVMAGAVIQAGTMISDNVIINTGAIVDHDCIIESHSHIAPGVTLCGSVHIGSSCLIGAGATIIQQLSVGNGSIVGAGAVVVNSVQACKKVIGVPAREVK